VHTVITSSPERRVRTTSWFLLSCVVVAFAACGGDASTAPKVSRVYLLQSVDGKSVPTVFDTGSAQWNAILSSTLTLDAQTDTAREVIQERVARQTMDPEDFTVTYVGRYSLRGDSLIIRSHASCGDICLPDRGGHIEGSTLTITDAANISPNPVFVYTLSPTSTQ
jgi:hypothetical protein